MVTFTYWADPWEPILQVVIILILLILPSLEGYKLLNTSKPPRGHRDLRNPAKRTDWLKAGSPNALNAGMPVGGVTKLGFLRNKHATIYLWKLYGKKRGKVNKYAKLNLMCWKYDLVLYSFCMTGLSLVSIKLLALVSKALLTWRLLCWRAGLTRTI